MRKYSFREISKIPLEELLNDRELQRDIHYSIYDKTTRDPEIADKEVQYNPNPTVILENVLDENSEVLEKDTFRIDGDKKHIYFFPTLWPTKEIPDYLKQEDLIPSGYSTLNNNLYETVRDESGITKEQLETEIYLKNKEILKKLGTNEVPFNKTLFRVKGEKSVPELYNQSTRQWEEYKGENVKWGYRETNPEVSWYIFPYSEDMMFRYDLISE
ncbi:MAG: hypothetical protein KAT28_04475 [Candidatus Aenigmarchaeota archaeon]|nr:hypothetical protein [Candidatus Aenigmarchaeota archaeon]